VDFNLLTDKEKRKKRGRSEIIAISCTNIRTCTISSINIFASLSSLQERRLSSSFFGIPRHRNVLDERDRLGVRAFTNREDTRAYIVILDISVRTTKMMGFNDHHHPRSRTSNREEKTSVVCRAELSNLKFSPLLNCFFLFKLNGISNFKRYERTLRLACAVLFFFVIQHFFM
jgi:hypothetical protein